MTKQELIDFCVENAGKIATGKEFRNGEVKRGRIIGCTLDADGRKLILIENEKGVEKKDLPNPLPKIPHFFGNWYRVVSPAKMGTPCTADSVVVEAIPPHVQAAVVKRKCGTSAPEHDICDPDWCKIKYMGWA